MKLWLSCREVCAHVDVCWWSIKHHVSVPVMQVKPPACTLESASAGADVSHDPELAPGAFRDAGEVLLHTPPETTPPAAFGAAPSQAHRVGAETVLGSAREAAAGALKLVADLRSPSRAGGVPGVARATAAKLSPPTSAGRGRGSSAAGVRGSGRGLLAGPRY